MSDIDVHFNRLGSSGATLVVVALGSHVYAATSADPLQALAEAARHAVDDSAARGEPLDVTRVVTRGEEELRARLARSSSAPHAA